MPGDPARRRAELIRKDKVVLDDGSFVGITIWAIPRTRSYPDGVRYSLAYVEPGNTRPIVLYDNHAGKGHHKHTGQREEAYPFVTIEGLVDDFLADVVRVRRGE